MSILIPKIQELSFKNESLAYRKAAIESKLQEIHKPTDVVEYRLEMSFVMGKQDYYDSLDDGLLKIAQSVKIIPLWEDYHLRFGYWCYRYYNQPTEDATSQEFKDWITSLKEPMKSKFKEDGLEECRGVVGFMRFVNELRDMGLSEFLQRNMSKEDWKEYLSLNEDD